MDRKRLLRVTAGDLRQKHLYIRGHLDFFPPDVVGPAKRSGSGHGNRGIELVLEGLGLTIETDIGRDGQNRQRCKSFDSAFGRLDLIWPILHDCEHLIANDLSLMKRLCQSIPKGPIMGPSLFAE